MASTESATRDVASFKDAHAALRGTAGLQFDFSPGPPTPVTSRWNLQLDGTLVLGVLIVIAIVFVMAGVVAVIRNRGPRSAAPPAATLDVVSRAAAQAALADADALAAAGRFLDAVHVLLTCGVDAIGRADPHLLRPADTSRDILRLSGLPTATRTAFAALAQTVEVGVFGGRPVGEAGYVECRATFVGSTMAAPR